MGKESTPGPQERRFAAYIEGLAKAAGHADRNNPLKNYCTALLLPGERKSVEPMAARLAPENVRRMHQSLHHVVADAPLSDEAGSQAKIAVFSSLGRGSLPEVFFTSYRNRTGCSPGSCAINLVGWVQSLQ